MKHVQILLEKNVLEEIEVIPEDSIIDCNNLTFQDLKKIAIKHNVSYIGKKKICNHLKKVRGYTFSKDVNIDSKKNVTEIIKRIVLMIMTVNGYHKLLINNKNLIKNF